MQQISITHKVSLYFFLMILLACTAVGGIAYYHQQQQLIKSHEEKMALLLDEKHKALIHYFYSINTNLQTLSQNYYTQNAMQAFASAWDELGTMSTTTLQTLYTKEAAKQKQPPHYPQNVTAYVTQHNIYHPQFTYFLKTYGLTNIYLIDTKGNIVYAAKKHDDFSTNILFGKWKDSNLASIFSQAARDPKHTHMTDYSLYTPNGSHPAGFWAKTLTNADGKITGVLAIQVPIAPINAIMATGTMLGETGESYLVGNDHLMRSHSRFTHQDVVLKHSVEGDTINKGLAGKEGVATIKDYRGITLLSTFKPFHFMNIQWAMIAEQSEQELLSPLTTLRNQLAIAAASMVILALLAGWLLGRSIALPLSAFVDHMQLLTTGVSSFVIMGKSRKDEIGQLANAIDTLKKSTVSHTKEETEQHQIAETEHNHTQHLESFIATFEEKSSSIVNAIATMASELHHTAEGMGQQVTEATLKSSEVANASSETSLNVQSVASAAEEMSASIKEIAHQMQTANDFATDSSNKAKAAGKSAEMLQKASESIGQIAKMIDDIAGQINLLALNATIESARAGEAGKGFAVVASEVKNLANQTAKATEEIAKEIQNVQNVATEVVAALGSMQQSISSVTESSSLISVAVKEQTAVTNEISANMQTASTGVDNISHNITDIANSTRQADDAVKLVQNSAIMLTSQAEKLRQEMQFFLSNIKTA